MAVQTVKATVNGQEYTLNYSSSSGKWEATINAPSESSWSQPDHTYPVTVKATDDAGNETEITSASPEFGEELKLRVLEKTAPVITPVYPTAGAYVTTATPAISWTVTDTGSGIDASTIALTVGGTPVAEGIATEPVENGYSCTYTPAAPLTDGENTITFGVSDNDGNAAAQTGVAFTVDTVAPSLDLTSPAEGLVTNTATVTVAGTTSDLTSGPVTVTITVNSQDQGAVTVEESGAFTKEVTLTNGANVIVVTAADKAGKSTSVTRNVTLDTGAPVFHSVTITPNPVDAGQTYIISVEVTDA